jgi:hypothetical protein
MNNIPVALPALYIIFTLLNAIRRGIPRHNIWREFRRQKVSLKPRLVFWIALCKEAGLIDNYEGRLRAARYARRWLNKPTDEQTLRLIEAWQNAPKNFRDRQFRKKLLWKLKFDKPLAQKDRQVLNGLQALGLMEGENLTTWGRFFIKGEGKLPTPKPPEPCRIHAGEFIASLPQHADLLWDLEKLLPPKSPGIYPITARACQCVSPEALIALLEHGMQSKLPKPAKAHILSQPSVQIRQGLVIEFSDAGALRQLRRQPNLRKHVEQYLSPRHVLISAANSNSLLKMFERRGVYTQFHEEPPEPERKRTHFQAKTLLQPVGKEVPKMELLNKYLQLQQALDILYRAPGTNAEQRRITPLSIEARGEHQYVIAYCHIRRGQRTFRLDRMEVPGTY